jgi:hypothetical protein
MTMAAYPAVKVDPFCRARERFGDLVAWLSGESAPMDHAIMEDKIAERGMEVLRSLYQGRLDLLSAREAAQTALEPVPEGTNARTCGRVIESRFGRVRFRRLGYKSGNAARRFPLDRQMNLPAGIYSHPLRRCAAEEARSAAYGRAVEKVDRTTGGHVPQRQAEEVASEVVQDFEAFYERRPVNDTAGPDALLLASSDCKGVRMQPEALRDATRKAAEEEKAEAVRGDPMAKKKPRQHDKRMAAVMAVWEQQPEPRTASDIVSELRRTPNKRVKRKTRPKPKNKRVWSTIEKNLSTGVSEMFDELDRRDPERKRHVPVLVDGDEKQQTAILDEARRRGRAVTIVLDIIHVIHYLWLAGSALCRGKSAATDVWVATHLMMLLTHPVARLIAAIQEAAAEKRLTRAEKRRLDKALKYLDRNADFTNYPAYLAMGLPIASGIIEGACRHLVQDRLGITGARWNLPGAEAILRLRALHISGDWDAYWHFHRAREAVRNYPEEALSAVAA